MPLILRSTQVCNELDVWGVIVNKRAVQACSRALIVDTLPIPKQQSGSAWASRMVAAGHLVGYVIGTVDLVGLLGPSWGSTQFQKLILLAAFSLLFSTAVTCWAVDERVLIAGRDGEVPAKGWKIIRQIFHAATTLPPRIQAICTIQMWSWVGWFPFLFVCHSPVLICTLTSMPFTDSFIVQHDLCW